MPFISSFGGQYGAIGRRGSGFNNAIGGNTTEILNYLGTGEIWRIHTWTGGGSQTFIIANSVYEWKFLLVGSGGTGGPDGGAGGGGGGSFEGTLSEDQLLPGTYSMLLRSTTQSSTLTIGATTLQVNSGGSGAAKGGGAGGGGTSGSLTNLTARTGGTGGSYNAGGGSGGFTSNISGSTLGYCGGGGAGGHSFDYNPLPGGGGVNGGGNGGTGGGGLIGDLGASNGAPGVRGGGGGGAGVYRYIGGSGSDAMLILAYRIG